MFTAADHWPSLWYLRRRKATLGLCSRASPGWSVLTVCDFLCLVFYYYNGNNYISPPCVEQTCIDASQDGQTLLTGSNGLDGNGCFATLWDRRSTKRRQVRSEGKAVC